MKKITLITILNFIYLISYEQILLEDKNGDVIVRNQFKANDNTAFIKLNTGEQTLGFNYIISTKLNSANNYTINEFGIKAKPTEGYASVFSNAQFSPGIKLSYAITKLRIFSKSIKNCFIDWANIEVSYDVNKYTLFNSDNTFSNQVYSKKFKAINALINYSYLVTAGSSSIDSKLLLTLKVGYSKRNNYDDLTSVVVEDSKSVIDLASSIERKITKVKNLRQGNFKQFDTYPLIFAVTMLTRTDPSTDPNAKKLRIGFTGYFKNLASTNLPKQTLGAMFFLTKQDKNGIRNPVFGLDMQADDPFNVNKSNEGFQNRISVGFTSIFSF